MKSFPISFAVKEAEAVFQSTLLPHLWQQERLSLHFPFLYLVLYPIGEGPYILLKSIY